MLFVPDALARSLSDLLALVKLLREDIAHQRQEIVYLRMLLENCAGCKEPSGDNHIRVEPNCRNANPCYPGKRHTQTQSIFHLHHHLLFLLPYHPQALIAMTAPRDQGAAVVLSVTLETARPASRVSAVRIDPASCKCSLHGLP